MPLMSWSESYSVQIPGIDNQHKQLFSLINQLHEAMAKGQANEEMGRILQELINYTKTHFAAEEKLLQSKNYPELSAHQAQHRQFTDKIIQFQRDFNAGKATLSVGLMTFLRDWLSSHILQTDKRYGEYLAAK